MQTRQDYANKRIARLRAELETEQDRKAIASKKQAIRRWQKIILVKAEEEDKS
jgi:hypothetical protein